MERDRFSFRHELSPNGKAIARSSAHTSSEHVSPAACSAFCYDRSEHVAVLSVVGPERELGQVQRQVGLADLVISADHATLEQAPEAIQVRGVDVPAHIFALRMADGLVRKAKVLQLPIAAVVTGRHQGDIASGEKVAGTISQLDLPVTPVRHLSPRAT